jgi:hypothetical protein
MNNDLANKIILKTIKLNKYINDKVKDTYNDKFKNNFIIGVHLISHMSKISEIRNMKKDNVHYLPEDYVKFIKSYIQKNKICNFKIYLVTDILTNIELFKKEFPNNVIYNEENIWLSKNKQDIEPHYGFVLSKYDENNCSEFLHSFNKNKPGLRGAEELFVDTLLLSKSNLFFWTPGSNVSKWVMMYNPNLKLICIQNDFKKYIYI